MRWVAAAAAVAMLRAATPGPVGALHQLLHPAAADPFAPVVAASALLAWTLAGWLLLVVLATLATRLPGALGRLATAVSRRIAPVAVRRALEAALGLTVAAGALTATPALAAGATPTAPRATQPVVAASLDWPSPATPSLDWPAPAPAATAATPPAAPTRTVRADVPDPTEHVVVQPGDTLWAIAADHLTAPTSAAVAQSWPRWWTANRGVIGADPDLIQPGTRLVLPTDPSSR